MRRVNATISDEAYQILKDYQVEEDCNNLDSALDKLIKESLI